MAHKHFANAGPSQDVESERISPCGAGESSPMVKSRHLRAIWCTEETEWFYERTLNSAGVMEPTVKTYSARLGMCFFAGDLRSRELHWLASTGGEDRRAERNQEVNDDSWRAIPAVELSHPGPK